LNETAEPADGNQQQKQLLDYVVVLNVHSAFWEQCTEPADCKNRM